MLNKRLFFFEIVDLLHVEYRTSETLYGIWYGIYILDISYSLRDQCLLM